jgi:very-short-patch-repair endonuclease
VLVGTGKGTREGDLVFRDARFILEIASKEHHSSWAARMRDHDRDIELALAGWLVLHATKPQLVSGPRSRALGAQLRELIAARSAPRA